MLNGGYWTTDTSGTLTVCKSTDSWNVHYDVSTNTLTLNGAKITGGYIPFNVGIYAAGQNVSLTIVLQGKNTITSDGYGIYVSSNSNGSASLTISGEEDGNLTASGVGGPGIQVLSSSGDAGIEFNAGGDYNGITTMLSVSNNALVDTRDSRIVVSGNNTGTGGLTPTGDGIVFNGNAGTVYGNVTLHENLTIGEGESLTLDDGASLSAGGHNVIVDGGTLDSTLATSLGDSVKYAPTITTTSPLSNGTVGTYY